MLLVMVELERRSLDPTIGRSIVAFGAQRIALLKAALPSRPPAKFLPTSLAKI
jgi:hypothetical protein